MQRRAELFPVSESSLLFNTTTNCKTKCCYGHADVLALVVFSAALKCLTILAIIRVVFVTRGALQVADDGG